MLHPPKRPTPTSWACAGEVMDATELAFDCHSNKDVCEVLSGHQEATVSSEAEWCVKGTAVETSAAAPASPISNANGFSEGTTQSPPPRTCKTTSDNNHVFCWLRRLAATVMRLLAGTRPGPSPERYATMRPHHLHKSSPPLPPGTSCDEGWVRLWGGTLLGRGSERWLRCLEGCRPTFSRNRHPRARISTTVGATRSL